ncbi:BTB/POZ domain-containing protein 6-B-like, partial [Paramacrobiotus metropolitanus]|uniref:BTB/POZ domain-containing protein 6-B-like n=1 Tax=Paramacrobiotus metropolitanus TaxID=2943436 RepID=UPI002445B4E3
MFSNSDQSSTSENQNPGRVLIKIGDCIKPLLIRREMSDVEFVVGRDYDAEQLFPAHRLIMSVRSAVFQTMFYGSMPEKCTAPIDIPDIHPEAFANVLCYMYTDTVTNFTQENVFDTLTCADKYDLPLLVTMCTDFVLDTVNVNNCLDILDNAVRCAGIAPKILEHCLGLVDESPIAIWESEQFCAIGHEALRIILQRDTLTANEYCICWAANQWDFNMCKQRNMDTSSANRREILGQMLFLLRFPLLTDAQLLSGPTK